MGKIPLEPFGTVKNKTVGDWSYYEIPFVGVTMKFHLLPCKIL
jgi:hypothetical protein